MFKDYSDLGFIRSNLLVNVALCYVCDLFVYKPTELIHFSS